MALQIDPDFKPYQERIFAVFQTAYTTALEIANEAFVAARSSGKEAAAAELRAMVAGVLGTTPPPAKPADSKDQAGDETEDDGKRAPRGSVRPAVIDALRKSKGGLKPAEISALTGVNENSVRGALNILLDQAITVKREDRWFLADQK